MRPAGWKAPEVPLPPDDEGALVVARALGYSPGTATCHVVAVGGTWHRYPASRAGS